MGSCLSSIFPSRAHVIQRPMQQPPKATSKNKNEHHYSDHGSSSSKSSPASFAIDESEFETFSLYSTLKLEQIEGKDFTQKFKLEQGNSSSGSMASDPDDDLVADFSRYWNQSTTALQNNKDPGRKPIIPIFPAIDHKTLKPLDPGHPDYPQDPAISATVYPITDNPEELKPIQRHKYDPSILEHQYYYRLSKNVFHTESQKYDTLAVNEYLLTAILGRGSFGKAVKSLDKAVLKRKREYIKVENEIAIMSKLVHKNILRLYEVIDDPSSKKLYMVLSFSDQGESKSQTDPALTESKARTYFQQLLQGLKYLHSRNIFHRDIKPANLLISGETTLKIADFGAAIEMETHDQTTTKTDGTPLFYAPETLQETPFQLAPVDIWAAGVTLYDFIYDKHPFSATQQLALFDEIRTKPITFDPESTNGPISKELLDLFSRIFERVPSKRITIDELLAHPWVTNTPITAHNKSLDEPAHDSSSDPRLNTLKSPASFRKASSTEPEHPGLVLSSSNLNSVNEIDLVKI